MQFKQFLPCRKCKGNGRTVPQGYFREEVERNGVKQKILKECPHHIQWRKTEEAYKVFVKNNFNPSYFENTDKDYVGTSSKDNIIRLKKYIESFATNSKVQSAILYFFGNNGTQKTVTANWIGSFLIKNDFDIKYILMNDLISTLWDSQRNEDLKLKLENLENCNLLIIDEAFDKKKSVIWSSGKQLGLIDEFIRTRIIKQKGMIFISNNSPGSIKLEGFGESLQDLIERELKKNDSLFIFRDRYHDTVGSIPERLF